MIAWVALLLAALDRRAWRTQVALSWKSNEVLRDNFGIRIVYEDKNAVVLWKASNVAVFKSEENMLRNSAAPSIQSWLLDKLNSTLIRAPSLDSPYLSGLIMVGKSDQAQLRLIDLQGEIIYEYVAIVEGMANNNSYITVNATIQIGCDLFAMSGTYVDGLSMISISVSKAKHHLASRLASFLSSIGYKIIVDGASPMLSLVQIRLVNSDGLIVDLDAFHANQQHLMPKKYLKFIRREAIFYERRQSLHIPPTPDSPDGNLTAPFRGMELLVSSKGLRPRSSSGVLVDAALRHIRSVLATKKTQRPIRILDVGCGCGALLLAALSEADRDYGLRNEEEEEMVMEEEGPLFVGTGIDLDEAALAVAARNAQRLSQSQPRRWVSHWHRVDFNRLAQAHHRLSSQSEQLHWGRFDVVLCNPPFLSAAATTGRVTAEADLVLVGGASALDAYASICRGIVASEGGGTVPAARPLLGPKGVVIFQTPGGSRGLERVQRLVHSLGFETLSVESDERGVRRGLVIARRG